MQQAGEDKADAGGGEAPANIEPTVRTKFADTANWVATLNTDKNGIAEVEFDMPENLTGGRSASGAWGTARRSAAAKPTSSRART